MCEFRTNFFGASAEVREPFWYFPFDFFLRIWSIRTGNIFSFNFRRDFSANIDRRREKKGLDTVWHRIKEFYTNEVQFPEITLYFQQQKRACGAAYMIGFTEVCRYYLLSVTKRDSILTPAELSTARLRGSQTLKTTENIVIIGVTNILEAQLQTPNSRRERSLRVQAPNLDQNATLLLESP